MLKRFRSLPEPLQRHLLIQFGLTTLFLLLSVLAIITYKDIASFLIGVSISVVYFIYTMVLFYRAANGKYVVIHGICSDAIISPIRRKVKAFYIKTETEYREVTIKVTARQRLKRVPIGHTVELYVDEKTTLHEKDGCHLLYSYWAVKIKET